MKKRCEELQLTDAFRRDGKRAYPDVREFIEVCHVAEDYLDYLATSGRIDDGKAFLLECEVGFQTMIEANKRNESRRYLKVVATTAVGIVVVVTKTCLTFFG